MDGCTYGNAFSSDASNVNGRTTNVKLLKIVNKKFLESR